MKTRFPSILGVFAAILMVASFVIPVNIAAPSAVSADPGIMKWDTVSTPGAGVGKNDILNWHAIGANTGQGSEILSFAAGNDGMTTTYIVRTWITPPNRYLIGISAISFLYSNIAGYVANGTPVFSTYPQHQLDSATGMNLFQVAVAPDDPKFFAVTAQHRHSMPHRPRQIWVTTDAGQNWDLAFNGTRSWTPTETIR